MHPEFGPNKIKLRPPNKILGPLYKKKIAQITTKKSSKTSKHLTRSLVSSLSKTKTKIISLKEKK